MRNKQKNKSGRMRNPLALAIALILLMMVGGCFFAAQGHSARKNAAQRTRITTGLIGEYAALILIAEEKGYFKANGLNVTISDYASGPAALQDLLAGKIDTAMAADFAGVRNSFMDEDLRILASMSESHVFYLLTDKTRGVNAISDLKGKKIGITQKTAGEFYLGRFLTFNHLRWQDVTIVDLPQAELHNAHKDGRIDAAVLFEPHAYQERIRLGNNALQWPVQDQDQLYSLLYTTGKLAREKPAALRQYMKAVVQAEKFIKEHEAEAQTIIARRLKYDQPYIEYIWPRFVFEASLDQELVLGLEDKARWSIENGITPATEIPNYLRFMHFDSLDHAKPGAVNVIR